MLLILVILCNRSTFTNRSECSWLIGTLGGTSHHRTVRDHRRLRDSGRAKAAGMDAGRGQHAPKWLVGLALAALGLSAIATRFWDEANSHSQRYAAQPRRFTATEIGAPHFTLRTVRPSVDSAELVQRALAALRPQLSLLEQHWFAESAVKLTIDPPAIDLLADANWRQYLLEARVICPPRRAPEFLVLLPTARVGEPKLFDPDDQPRVAKLFAIQSQIEQALLSAGYFFGHERTAQLAANFIAAPPVTNPRTPYGPMPANAASAAQNFRDWLSQAGDDSPTRVPPALFKQLDRLTYEPTTAAWARQTITEVHGYVATFLASQQQGRLARILAASQSAVQMADATTSPRLATLLRQAHYGLERRLAVWQSTNMLAARKEQLLAEERGQIIARIASRSFDLRGLGSDLFSSADADITPEIPLAVTELQNPLAISGELEKYESNASPTHGVRIAQEQKQFASANDPVVRDLAGAMEVNYRNANLRVAIAAELVERLLPQPAKQTEPVRQRIAGASVSGWSTASTKLALQLSPDSQAWRGDFLARGVVTSTTSARGGPAVVRNAGTANYTARKPVVMTSAGIKAEAAQAEIASQTRLVGMSTNYDGVPLLGAYVRGRVREEYAAKRGVARVQTENQIRQRVCQQFDAQLAEAIQRGEDKYSTQIATRLEKLGLTMTPVELSTSQSRLVARVRVAADNQLAAHTPRIIAPGDSVLSMQLHESVLNNLAHGLALSGEQFTMDELQARLVDRLQLAPVSEDAERCTLRFAAHDAVRSVDAGHCRNASPRRIGTGLQGACLVSPAHRWNGGLVSARGAAPNRGRSTQRPTAPNACRVWQGPEFGTPDLPGAASTGRGCSASGPDGNPTSAR